MGQGHWQVVKMMTRYKLRKYSMNEYPNAGRVKLKSE